MEKITVTDNITLYIKEFDGELTFTSKQFSDALSACIIENMLDFVEIDNIYGNAIDYTISIDSYWFNFSEDGELISYEIIDDKKRQTQFYLPKNFYELGIDDIDDFIYIFGNENEQATLKISLFYDELPSELRFEFDSACLNFREKEYDLSKFLTKRAKDCIEATAYDNRVESTVWEYLRGYCSL